MEAQRKAAVATAQEEPAEAALEQRVAGGEKSLSVTEFTELIALADSLRQYDERKRAISPEESLSERIGGGGYSVGTAYEVAQELGIDADHMKRAEHILFPTAEMQLADITDVRAIPSMSAIRETYRTSLLNELQQYLPWTIIVNPTRVHSSDILFCKEERELVVRNRFWRKEQRQERILFRNLAFFDFWNGEVKPRLKITIYNPIFLRACGKKLKELCRHFEPALSVKIGYDYAVEI